MQCVVRGDLGETRWRAHEGGKTSSAGEMRTRTMSRVMEEERQSGVFHLPHHSILRQQVFANVARAEIFRATRDRRDD